MAKFSVSVRPYKCSARPNAKWVLNVWHPTGKRERSYFETKEAAQAAEQVKSVEVQRLGWQALQIDDKLRLEALDAREKLAPYGVSLTAIVAEYIRRRGASSITVDEIAEQFLASRSKLERSEKHLDSLRRLFNRFGASFPSDRLADLTSDQVEGWLHDLKVGPVTVNTYRSLLNSLFEFGVRKKLCPENPVKAVERMTVKADEVGILTTAQLSNLLEISADDVRATVALGAFAGIRPEEIVRLTWEEISLEKGHITITAAKSKTAQHRYVKILPRLEAWLRPLIGSGSIQGDNFRRRYDETRRLAGFALRGNRRQRHDEDPGLVPWPHDGLRHSFASYHLAKFQNAPALALELGHQSNALIFSNYRRRVTELEANEYFNLLPKVSDLEQAASCLGEDADAAARAAAPLPCLNRNNCTVVPPAARKTAWLLEESVKRFIKRFGFQNVGFLTLTFAEHIVDPKEAQKRWHSVKTHVLNKRYHGRWIRVIERQKSKRLHYHVLIAIGDDIRAGADFTAFTRRDYRSANSNLRREWAFWRITAPKYRFGRTEIMPLYKTEEAVAKYLGKYIAKHIEKRLSIDKGMRMVEYGRGCRIGTTKFQFNTPGAWLWRQKLRRFAHQISPERSINMEGLARRLGRGKWLVKHFGRIMSIDLQGVSFPTQYLWILHETVRGRMSPDDTHLALLCEVDSRPETGYSWPGSWKSLENAIGLFWSKVRQLRKVGGSEPRLVPRWNGGLIPADRVPNPANPY